MATPREGFAPLAMAMNSIPAGNGMEKSFFQQRSGRNRNFTHRENIELIRIWGNTQVQRKYEGCYRNSRQWEIIAEQMQQAGFNRSYLECKTRVANLKAQYFKIKRGIQPGSCPPDWPYFKMLGVIIEGKLPQQQNLTLPAPIAVDSMESADCLEEYDFNQSTGETPNGSTYATNYPLNSTADSSSHDSYAEGDLSYPNNGNPAETPDKHYNQRGGRNRNFTHEETVELLQIWGSEAVQRKFESSYRNSRLWEFITKRMINAGYPRSLLECKTRIANLKCQYYKIKRQMTPGSNPDWPYWDTLHSIMEGRPIPPQFSHPSFGENNESQNSNGDAGDDFDFSRLNGDLEANGASFAGASYPASFIMDDSSPHQSDLDDESLNSDCGPEGAGEPHRKRNKRRVDELVMFKLLDIERRSLTLQEERNEDERKMFKAVADFFNAMTGLITGSVVPPSSPSCPPSTLSETMLSLVNSLHSAQQKIVAFSQSSKDSRHPGAPDFTPQTTPKEEKPPIE